METHLGLAARCSSAPRELLVLLVLLGSADREGKGREGFVRAHLCFPSPAEGIWLSSEDVETFARRQQDSSSRTGNGPGPRL